MGAVLAAAARCALLLAALLAWRTLPPLGFWTLAYTALALLGVAGRFGPLNALAAHAARRDTALAAWLLLRRTIALCYAAAFGSLAREVLGLVGSRGLSPCAQSLAANVRDLSGAARLAYLPSLLELTGASDGALLALCYTGLAVACALLRYPCGRWAAAGFAALWACLGSFSICEGAQLWFPWDSMLLEAGALAALLLPASARAAPRRSTALAFRLLLLRVLVGFGKFKFLGANAADERSYLHRFFLNAPLLSYGGLLAHRLVPSAATRAPAVAFWMLAELLLPWCLLLPARASASSAWAARFARARFISGASTTLLMVGIGLGGSFGWFNLLTAGLAIACACADVDGDGGGGGGGIGASAGVGAKGKSAGSAPRPAGPLRLLSRWLPPCAVALWALLSVEFFLQHSQWAAGHLQWGDSSAYGVRVRGPLGRALVTASRVCAGWRLLNPYGVFPPHAMPAYRQAAVLEVQRGSAAADADWQPVRYHWQVTGAGQVPPLFSAPLMRRADYLAMYMSEHLLDSPVSPFVGLPRMATSPMKLAHRYAWALLGGYGGGGSGGQGSDADVRSLFAHVPRPAPGRDFVHAVRVRGVVLVWRDGALREPRTRAEALRAGASEADAKVEAEARTALATLKADHWLAPSTLADLVRRFGPDATSAAASLVRPAEMFGFSGAAAVSRDRAAIDAAFDSAAQSGGGGGGGGGVTLRGAAGSAVTPGSAYEQWSRRLHREHGAAAWDGFWGFVQSAPEPGLGLAGAWDALPAHERHSHSAILWRLTQLALHPHSSFRVLLDSSGKQPREPFAEVRAVAIAAITAQAALLAGQFEFDRLLSSPPCGSGAHVARGWAAVHNFLASHAKEASRLITVVSVDDQRGILRDHNLPWHEAPGVLHTNPTVMCLNPINMGKWQRALSMSEAHVAAHEGPSACAALAEDLSIDKYWQSNAMDASADAGLRSSCMRSTRHL